MACTCVCRAFVRGRRPCDAGVAPPPLRVTTFRLGGLVRGPFVSRRVLPSQRSYSRPEHVDAPLTPTGFEQAQSLASALTAQPVPVDVVLVSPLMRYDGRRRMIIHHPCSMVCPHVARFLVSSLLCCRVVVSLCALHPRTHPPPHPPPPPQHPANHGSTVSQRAPSRRGLAQGVPHASHPRKPRPSPHCGRGTVARAHWWREHLRQATHSVYIPPGVSRGGFFAYVTSCLCLM